MDPNRSTGTVEPRPWRTWVGDPNNPGLGVQGVRTDVPPSTAKIPLELYKRVNVDHLESIGRTGLESTLEGVLFHGYSKGTPYANRDAYLLAVWLGTSTTPGESMQPSVGAFTDLTIRVSQSFRDAHLRDANAVRGRDDETSSGTVLSFATIPPDRIFLTISEKQLTSLKERDRNTRLKAGEVPLSKIIPAEFRHLVAILKEESA
jgi:hypothetical protein